jgi:Skp family chaperone for outer membrane proteins
LLQEKCDEDLTTLSSDLQSKTQEYDRKEEALKAKRDSELHKLKVEFEQKARVSSLRLLLSM